MNCAKMIKHVCRYSIQIVVPIAYIEGFNISVLRYKMSICNMDINLKHICIESYKYISSSIKLMKSLSRCIVKVVIPTAYTENSYMSVRRYKMYVRIQDGCNSVNICIETCKYASISTNRIYVCMQIKK